MSILQIRDLFSFYGSYLSGQILDVDGVTIDPAQLIGEAAQSHGINPQLLLAKLQGENSSIRRAARPDPVALKTLMGCGGGGNARTSMRNQITCAAQNLRLYFDQQEPPNGQTSSGWRVGVAKQTQNQVNTPANPYEGLWVTPATKATAALYTYTPYRGADWGGVRGGNALLVKVLRKTLKLYAVKPNTGHEYYDESGTLVHRFLTHNAKTGEYTFDWSMEPEYEYDSWGSLDGMQSGITGYLPGQATYNVGVAWDLKTYDYCKRDTDPGDPQDYNFYNGDCFVAAISPLEYWELRETWQPSWYTTYSANIVNEPGYISLEGGLTKPADQGPYVAVPRVSTTQKAVVGTPGEGRILNVLQDSEYRPEYPTFPSWGKVKMTIK
jgi:hypothetical protein